MVPNETNKEPDSRFLFRRFYSPTFKSDPKKRVAKPGTLEKKVEPHSHPKQKKSRLKPQSVKKTNQSKRRSIVYEGESYRLFLIETRQISVE
jgi:hypothetical protein